MRLVRRVVISLVLVASCSRSHSPSVATVETPWSHADSHARDGWWKNWDSSLGGNPPFGVGTRFEFETIGPDGSRQFASYEVKSIRPASRGAYQVVLESGDGTFRASLPPPLAYSPGKVGWLTSRNEKLVSVTVPGGTFAAGRLWRGEHYGRLVYERDEWVVPDLPLPVQSWSRPVGATELYNPPADGTIPEGTSLSRLVRIERK